MASGDSLNLEQVGRLVSIGGLPEGYLLACRVEGVGSDKVRGTGNILPHCPGEGGVRRSVWLFDNIVLASFVLSQLVDRFSPPTVLLADRSIAQLYCDVFVGGVSPGWEGGVKGPCQGYVVLSGLQNCVVLWKK